MRCTKWRTRVDTLRAKINSGLRCPRRDIGDDCTCRDPRCLHHRVPVSAHLRTAEALVEACATQPENGSRQWRAPSDAWSAGAPFQAVDHTYTSPCGRATFFFFFACRCSQKTCMPHGNTASFQNEGRHFTEFRPMLIRNEFECRCSSFGPTANKVRQTVVSLR